MTKSNIVRVAEDVLADPGALRQTALAGEYYHPKDLVGWRTPPVQIQGIGARIERLFGVRITRWYGPRESCTLFLAFARGARTEVPLIHTDMPPNAITLVTYLNRNAPTGTGTSLWRHRKTGLTGPPAMQQARRLGFRGKRDTLDRWIDQWLWKNDRDLRRWQEVVRVENVYNRGVMFRGGVFHSATKHFGDSPENGRFFAQFHFAVAD